MGFLNNNATVLYSCIAYAHSHAPRIKKGKKNWKQYIIITKLNVSIEIKYLGMNQQKDRMITM